MLYQAQGPGHGPGDPRGHLCPQCPVAQSLAHRRSHPQTHCQLHLALMMGLCHSHFHPHLLGQLQPPGVAGEPPVQAAHHQKPGNAH